MSDIAAVGLNPTSSLAESFFAALKNELVYRQTWRSRTQARRAIFAYVEGFFNRSWSG